VFDLVQNYGKQKYLIPPNFGKETMGQSRKILDVGVLDETIIK